jgi:hypothetical protein
MLIEVLYQKPDPVYGPELRTYSLRAYVRCTFFLSVIYRQNTYQGKI